MYYAAKQHIVNDITEYVMNIKLYFLCLLQNGLESLNSTDHTTSGNLFNLLK
jgi:hypothetical protein